MSFFPNSDMNDDMNDGEHDAPADDTAPADTGASRIEAERLRNLYPNSAHSDTAAPAEVEVPEGVRELRADPARRMFSAKSMYGDSVKFDEVPLDATAEERAAIEQSNNEALEILADYEFSGAEANQVIDLFRQAAVNPPSDEQRAAWRADAEQQLRRAYGSDASHTLALAKQLVARDPRARALLEATGLGDHPDVVMKITRVARSQKASGKLK